MVAIYRNYDDNCRRSSLVDFTELLLRAHELLRNNPDTLAHYQQRFCHILVDEFQDTNTIQYAWIRLLAGKTNHVMIVGDDDQSIYSWRGANVEHIHRFQKDFAGVTTIKLEQNYRSTETILSAANAIISLNSNRMGKELWTEGNQGEPIIIYPAFNEIDEARYVCMEINRWTDAGNPRQDTAILYRSNAQSRVLEEELIRQNIPYRIYGGHKFFERAEIKTALSYLRLTANHNDDAAFERIINTPTRGIGLTTVNTIRQYAQAHELSLWAAAKQMLETKTFSSRAGLAINRFIELINELTEQALQKSLYELTEAMIIASELVQHYKKDRSEKGLSRVENIEELLNATRTFRPDPNEDLPMLSAFLSATSLDSGDTQAEGHQDAVQLMTLHAAKGLEFPVVFIVGMEERLFPHQMSMEESGRLEEERRLCYVGMTRAEQKLFLCYAESRRLHGSETYNRPSRFLSEIPEELTETVRPKIKSQPANHFKAYGQAKLRRPTATNNQTDTGYRLGQQVLHKKFGSGTITNFEGSGNHARVQVNFDSVGSKWLVASFAKLIAQN